VVDRSRFCYGRAEEVLEPMSTLIGPAVLDPSLYISELKLRRKPAVLEELVAHATRAGVVREPDVLRATLVLRERLCGTGIGKGVAIPNARSVSVVEPRLLVAPGVPARCHVRPGEARRRVAAGRVAAWGSSLMSFRIFLSTT